MHALGQAATLIYVYFVLAHFNISFLLLAPFVVYPFAWFGHFYYEKNEPAAFKNPIWAKACDWIMLKDMITGKIKW